MQFVKPFWFHQTLEYAIKSMKWWFFGLMAPPWVELTQRWRYRVPLGGHSTAIYLSTNLFRRLNSSNMLLGEVSLKSDSHLHGTVNISHHDSVTVGHGISFWEVFSIPMSTLAFLWRHINRLLSGVILSHKHCASPWKVTVIAADEDNDGKLHICPDRERIR